MSKIYLISPAKIELANFAKKLDILLKNNSLGAFQLRLKDCNNKEIEQATKTLLPICKNHQVPFFINDFYQIARDYDIDGIHIGQNDGNLIKLKKEFHDKIIGVSCQNSLELALEAKEQGADYVSFGSFFATKSKKNTKSANLDILAWWKEKQTLPCAAIGGINQNNITQIAKLKADFICIISAIWNHPQGCNEGLKILGSRKFL